MSPKTLKSKRMTRTIRPISQGHLISSASGLGPNKKTAGKSKASQTANGNNPEVLPGQADLAHNAVDSKSSNQTKVTNNAVKTKSSGPAKIAKNAIKSKSSGKAKVNTGTGKPSVAATVVDDAPKTKISGEIKVAKDASALKTKSTDQTKNPVIQALTAKLAEKKERLIKGHIERIRMQKFLKVDEAKIKVTEKEEKKRPDPESKKEKRTDLEPKKEKRPSTSVPKNQKLKSVSKVKRTSVSTSAIGKGNLASKTFKVKGSKTLGGIEKQDRPGTALNIKSDGDKQVTTAKDTKVIKQGKSKSLSKLQPTREVNKSKAYRPSSKQTPIRNKTTPVMKAKSEVGAKLKANNKKGVKVHLLKAPIQKLKAEAPKQQDPETVGIGESKFSPGNLSLSIKLKPKAQGNDKFLELGIPTGPYKFKDTESQTQTEVGKIEVKKPSQWEDIKIEEFQV